MSQGSLPGFEPANPTDRLFLAIFPDAQHAAQLAALAAQHLGDHRLGNGATEAGRLHVTLFDLGDYTELPPGLVTHATEALSRLAAMPFIVHFDQIGSFSRQSIGPLVLSASDGNEELHALRKQLATHLRASALGRLTHDSFTPHMTVAYKAATIPFEKIAPIAWPAGEVALIHSLLGKTRHIRLVGKQLG